MTVGRKHTLKVEHEYMDALKGGEKTFEVRRDDRGYQRGDTLILCRYGKCRESGHSYGYMDHKGRVVSKWPEHESVDRTERVISYILTGGHFGIEPGYIVLGLQFISRGENQ